MAKIQVVNSVKEHFLGSRLWYTVLLVYLLLIGVTGYVAFSEQEFNGKPSSSISVYMKILSDYQKTSPDEESKNQMEEIIRGLIQRDSESASELQDLANQAFNIMLGALLAFLSASSTMLFQGDRKSNVLKPSEENSSNTETPTKAIMKTMPIDPTT